MNRIFFLIHFLFTIVSTWSQPNLVNEEGGTFQTGNLDVPFLRVSEISGNKIVGSIYISEEWEQATIIDLSNKKRIKILARFNVYHGEIEILKDKEISALYPTKGIKVQLNGKNLVPLHLGKRNKPIFAEILAQGKYNLYKVFDIKINKAPSDAKLLNIESVDKVEIVHQFYFNREEGQVAELPTNKRTMKSELPSSIMEILKKEKLSARKEEDLIKLFSILNSQ
ncbi:MULTISPECIES: hypothetical protein [Maribacter]|uniref:Uncharacterized protein n=2 Tax=Maribacter TaxID=252356 RepID=A0A5R8MAY4_9FLAO|nr:MULTISPECIES: hypothetical protein [Maribacter]MDC6404442.1 hypothetical protein [Maribacter sp. PR66]MEE1971586.1 hypothetical protein [Maribacter flavus]TLF46723.1 hypothetical protein FEK29_02805 [Maribacter aurantiacus]